MQLKSMAFGHKPARTTLSNKYWISRRIKEQQTLGTYNAVMNHKLYTRLNTSIQKCAFINTVPFKKT